MVIEDILDNYKSIKGKYEKIDQYINDLLVYIKYDTNLPEYTELNLAEIWTPELRKEFISKNEKSNIFTACKQFESFCMRTEQ